MVHAAWRCLLLLMGAWRCVVVLGAAWHCLALRGAAWWWAVGGGRLVVGVPRALAHTQLTRYAAPCRGVNLSRHRHPMRRGGRCRAAPHTVPATRATQAHACRPRVSATSPRDGATVGRTTRAPRPPFLSSNTHDTLVRRAPTATDETPSSPASSEPFFELGSAHADHRAVLARAGRRRRQRARQAARHIHTRHNR